MRRLNPQSVTLHSRASQPRLDYGQLQLEPAIPTLDWLFTPSPRLEEPMHGEPLQASTAFYRRFALPRVRSSGFGSYAGDLWRFHTTLLINCELSVSLRLPGLLRLASPRTYTPWHVIQNGRCTAEAAHLSITKRFHALFTLCEEFFSAFPRGTGYAIGLTTYLGLEVVVPQLRTPYPRRAIQDTHTSSHPSLTGLSPSLAPRSSGLKLG